MADGRAPDGVVDDQLKAKLAFRRQWEPEGEQALADRGSAAAVDGVGKPVRGTDAGQASAQGAKPEAAFTAAPTARWQPKPEHRWLAGAPGEAKRKTEHMKEVSTPVCDDDWQAGARGEEDAKYRADRMAQMEYVTSGVEVKKRVAEEHLSFAAAVASNAAVPVPVGAAGGRQVLEAGQTSQPSSLLATGVASPQVQADFVRDSRQVFHSRGPGGGLSLEERLFSHTSPPALRTTNAPPSLHSTSASMNAAVAEAMSSAALRTSDAPDMYATNASVVLRQTDGTDSSAGDGSRVRIS